MGAVQIQSKNQGEKNGHTKGKRTPSTIPVARNARNPFWL
jgi:hypothetical protein